MTLDIWFFALAVPAVLFAGISKGGFGNGAAFAATPILAMILEPGQAIGLMLPLLMVMDLGAMRSYWRKWHWPTARALILGAVPGIALGMAIYGITKPDTFRVAIGLVAVGFVLWQWARARGMIAVAAKPLSERVGVACGAVAGLTSFISHAGGPPAAIFLLSRQLDKTTFQATTVLTFFTINLCKLGPYVVMGIIGTDTLTGAVLLAPVAIIGVQLGVVMHRIVPEKAYFALAYALLLATGCKLLFDGLT